MGCWEHISTKLTRSLLDGYLFVGTKNCLFLVGRIELYNTYQSMRISKWDNVKKAQIKTCRMPQFFFRFLLRLSVEQFECSMQDTLIYFTSWNHGRSLIYDVEKKTWPWISGCALRSQNNQAIFMNPRLILPFVIYAFQSQL